jgi:hypothetical protein
MGGDVSRNYVTVALVVESSTSLSSSRMRTASLWNVALPSRPLIVWCQDSTKPLT